MVDGNYFDIIDSEYKAYWLGFIFGDGCVYDTGEGKYLQIVLKSSDREHIQKFLDIISPRSRIYDIHGVTKSKIWTCCRCAIGSKILVNTLAQYGIVPNKTFKLDTIPYDKINKRYLRHFIRGYFDADGSIFISKGKYVTISFTGNKPFIENLKDFIERNSRLNLFKHKASVVIKVNEKTAFIQYNGKYAKRILNYMYNNSNIYLDRKYKLFKENV